MAVELLRSCAATADVCGDTASRDAYLAAADLLSAHATRLAALEGEIAEAENVADGVKHFDTALAQRCYADGLKRARDLMQGTARIAAPTDNEQEKSCE